MYQWCIRHIWFIFDNEIFLLQSLWTQAVVYRLFKRLSTQLKIYSIILYISYHIYPIYLKRLRKKTRFSFFKSCIDPTKHDKKMWLFWEQSYISVSFDCVWWLLCTVTVTVNSFIYMYIIYTILSYIFKMLQEKKWSKIFQMSLISCQTWQKKLAVLWISLYLVVIWACMIIAWYNNIDCQMIYIYINFHFIP